MNWYHKAPLTTEVMQADIVPDLWKGPFPTLRAARDDAIVCFQWEKKAIEDKIKVLRAIDLRYQSKVK